MDTLEIIKNILLNHSGKANAIAAKEIARMADIPKSESSARVRVLIFQCAKKYRLPLAADVHGYYIIENDAEYAEYMHALEHRITGITEREFIITQNYKKEK